jgi:antitoxin component YwqK of YwqJK toxin-antitoxin module
LKTKLSLSLLYFFITFLLVSFSDPYSIKRISDQDFRYEFYVTNKTITPKVNKVYYWFKGGSIHSAQGDFGGDLLNEVFLKTYHSNQIAEKGNFKNGLKVGIWKTWHPNGSIESTQKWTKGLRTGMYYKYDENGLVAETGCYKNDKKQGKWYDFVKKDTVNYNNGVPALKKQKISKLDKLTLKLQELKDEQNKKTAIESEKTKIKQAKTAEKEYIKAQELALEKEKASAKMRKKEADEAEKATKLTAKATKKALKEGKKNKKALDKANNKANINSGATPKKENLFNRYYNKLFKKKTSK